MEVRIDLPPNLGSRLVGSRGQRVEFVTQDDIGDVLEALREKDLKLVGIKGGRVYGRLSRYTEPATYLDEGDASTYVPKKLMVEEVGTAAVRVQTPGGKRSRRGLGSYGNPGPVSWEGEGSVEGGYVVTVMVPEDWNDRG